MNRRQRIAARAWSRRGLVGVALFLALVPFSVLYGIAVCARNALYAIRVRRPKRMSVPVLSVGNLTVGGTGKTPVVIWLAEELERRGFHVAVLSRGYKRRGGGVRVVGEGGRQLVSPDSAGDEPALMARRLRATVVVGGRRVLAAREAVRRGAQVLVMDDGFQHRALGRDFDLLLCDRQKRAGDRWLLPAGRLREPRAGAARADAALLVARESLAADASAGNERSPRGLRKTPCFRTTIAPASLVVLDGGVWADRSLGIMAGQRVLAVSGIAGADAFYGMLRDCEANIVEVLEFEDHHRYDRDDWRAITTAARGADLIVTTEKDLVKLEQFPFAYGRIAALRLEVRIDDAAGLLAAVSAAIDGARSR